MDEAAEILREQANGHRIYGASKAHRFLDCLGSLRAEFGLPDTARFEAAEGTVAHEICDQWLKNGKPPRHRIGELVTMKLSTGTYHIPIDEAMLTHCGQHVERCRSAPGDHYFEQFVDYSELTPIPDQGGTGDHFACAYQLLTLDDFKYGVADQIWAHRNPQVSLYALGVIFKWDWLYSFDKVVIRINQPRLNHFDVWETTVTELMEFAAEAKIKMHAAWKPDAPRTPSEKACRYCKAKLTCVEANGLVEKIIDAVFEDESNPLASISGVPALWTEPPPLKALFKPQWGRQTTRVLVFVLRYRKLVERLFVEAHDELTSRVFAGETAEGWFLAEGKASRSVRDRNGILSTLAANDISPAVAYETDFLSPAKLEALLVRKGFSLARAKTLLEPFIRTIPGSPIVSQIRPGKRAARDVIEGVFEDESEA